jgi:hypothetical protein
MDFVKNSQKFFNDLYFNPTVTVVLSLALILYIAVAAPKVPSNVTKVLDNVYLKVALILFIGYVASKDASLALILAIALLVTLQTANRQKLSNSTLDNLKPSENFEELPKIDYVATGMANDNVKGSSVSVAGMDKDDLAFFNPVKESTLVEQTVKDLPKDIPAYVAESVSLYEPSNNKPMTGDYCGNDSSFNKNGSVDSGLLLDDNKVKTEQKNRLPTNVAGQDNCSGNADVSNFATGYSGLELADF